MDQLESNLYLLSNLFKFTLHSVVAAGKLSLLGDLGVLAWF